MNELVTSDSQLKPGDHVQIVRGPYRHCGIYEGDGKIIHVSNVDKSGSQRNNSSLITGSGRAKVRRDDLSDVAGKSSVYKNNSLDAKHRPRRPSEIVESARQYVDKEIPYNVLTNNCENFATFMRNGFSRSEQADSVMTRVTVAVAGVLAYFVYKLVRYFKGTERRSSN